MTTSPAPTSTPTPLPGSGRSTLDAKEAELRALLEAGDPAQIAAFHDSLPAAPSPPALPEAEPGAAARFFAELHFLSFPALRATALSASAFRGGYAIESDPGSASARVVPAFAMALAGSASPSELHERFGDLWAVDFDLYEALDTPPREIARKWLESPGRRLLQDLHALPRMPSKEALGATRVDLPSIHRAAGVHGAPAPSEEGAFSRWIQDRPASWRALHLAVPGAPMLRWAPEDERPTSAFSALELTEEGCPAMLRGAALAFLIRRLGTAPAYEINGVSRDLRDELPGRLAVALQAEPTSTASRAPVALEEIALAHAVRICAADTAPGSVFRTWGVARWIAACAWRSPFFGGDEPTLVERLRALLPSTRPSSAPDPLAPSRFDRRDGLDIGEVAVVAGALAHPVRTETGIAVPPLPLVRAMRRIAGRATLRSQEIEAEHRLASTPSELFWRAPHIAPPIVARWWLSERQLPFLADAAEAVQIHCIKLLADGPEHLGWLCFSILGEGPSLTPESTARAVTLWRSWRSGGAAPLKYEQAAFGIGILGGLHDDEAAVLLDVASKSESSWAPFLLDAAAKEAEKQGRADVWRGALERLLQIVASTVRDAESRLNAALFMAWRTSSKKLRADDLVERLSDLSQRPPMNKHPGLQRELRRRRAG